MYEIAHEKQAYDYEILIVANRIIFIDCKGYRRYILWAKDCLLPANKRLNTMNTEQIIDLINQNFETKKRNYYERKT